MYYVHPAWEEHQRKRWMRHDASRYLQPDWRDRKYWNGPPPPDWVAHPINWTPQAQAEFIRNGGARLSAADVAEIAEIRRELIELKALVEQARAASRAQALQRKYSPDQPRVPAGNSDGGQWTSEGVSRLHVAGLAPKIPGQRPPTSEERTAIAKAVAIWLAEKAVSAADVIAKTSWLYDAVPYINSYLDAPKSLEELQQDASASKTGYDRHHIVEQTSAEEDGYPRQRIDDPDNLVRVPRLKHWEINAWYQRPNRDFGELSPREYLRGKDWDERRRIG